jgi:hypothetical protein
MSSPFISDWMQMLAGTIFGRRASIHQSDWVLPDRENVSSSRNGGRNGTVEQAKRAARKERNRAAYRRACK